MVLPRSSYARVLVCQIIYLLDGERLCRALLSYVIVLLGPMVHEQDGEEQLIFFWKYLKGSFMLICSTIYSARIKSSANLPRSLETRYNKTLDHEVGPSKPNTQRL